MTQQNDATAPDWWRTAVIYQVYVRSFADSNGDGIGDLAGVRGRLDYLAELGVDAIWLTPFYASPMVDGGYDVADYRVVDPIFGDVAEATGLIEDAHERGLRILFDIVPNHTSSHHVWFRRALAAAAGDPARGRYHFRDGKGAHGEFPPNDWESVFGGPAWTRITEPDGEPGQWYLHLFDSEQPDLDWENPEVRGEFEDILRFWLDLGVDGFRVDVAHGLVKAQGLPDTGTAEQIALLGSAELPYFDQDGVHEIYRQWRKILDSYPGQRIGVAEAWAPNAERLALYLRPDELHQAFNFHYVQTAWSAHAFREVIDGSLDAAGSVGAPSTWVLSNHDINRHVTRYGGGERGQRRARSAVLLNLSLPGSAYLYQGEELGLPEVVLPDELITDPRWERSGRTDRGRDGCRVPLPWSGDSAPFGFSPDGAADPWLPQPSDWGGLTVAAQRDDPASMLSLYREALRLRAELPELATAPLRWLDGHDSGAVLTFGRGDDFVCTVNTATEPVELALPGELLLSSTGVDQPRITGQTVTLPADGAAWWRRTGEA